MNTPTRVFLVALAVSGLLACGGGTAPGASVQTTRQASALGTVTVALAAPSQARSQAANDTGSTTWVTCADENGNCAFTDLRSVRYGADGHYAIADEIGPVGCDNRTFGDPVIGVVKSCAYSMTAWVRCAAEGDSCRFDGTRQVRYGTVEHHVDQEATGSIACSNAVFGDPLVGVVKACWYEQPADAAGGAADPCDALPAMPTLPAHYIVVTSFCVDGHCALPDDNADDTDAIQKALDASAGNFLVFPPGTYRISRSLRVRQPGITLWGPGATIHATNWDDQSIVVEANDTSIYSFRMTAVTVQRGSRAEHTRIAIYGPAGTNPIVKNTIIRNNQIVNAGDPGTELANASTGAGIFVNAADGFLIAGNTVARTLADGIHITGGSRNGRVLGNIVRETGDDMIAMVSYAYPDPYANVAATIAANFSSNLERYSDRDILVAGNTLSGQYWGRGISVIGGRSITIRDNALSNLPYGAAVMLAREPQSGSYGLDNIVVTNNTIKDVQTLAPPYDFGGKFASHGRTGHGAVEIESAFFIDELAYPEMADGFAVKNIAVEGNRVTASATPAVRDGEGTGGNWRIGSRPATGGNGVMGASFDGNLLAQIQSTNAIRITGGSSRCSANTRDGQPLAVANCTAAPPPVLPHGADLACSRH